MTPAAICMATFSDTTVYARHRGAKIAREKFERFISTFIFPLGALRPLVPRASH